MRCSNVLTILLLFFPGYAAAQTANNAMLFGLGGAVVAHLPTVWQDGCSPSGSGVQAFGHLGRAFGNTAIVVEGGITTAMAGSQCVSTGFEPDTVIRRDVALREGYPLKSVGAYLRRDVAVLSGAPIHVLAGGGVIANKDRPYFQLGVGTLLGQHSPRFAMSVRYTHYSIPQQTTVYTIRNHTGTTQILPSDNAMAHVLDFRMGLEARLH